MVVGYLHAKTGFEAPKAIKYTTLCKTAAAEVQKVPCCPTALLEGKNQINLWSLHQICSLGLFCQNKNDIP